MTAEVSPAASVTLDGSGNGQVSLSPPSGTIWRLRLASVSTTGTVSQPQAFLYRGSASGPLEQIDSTFLGNSASSAKVAGAPFFAGQVLWAKWTGGDPGATATLQAWGQQGRRGEVSPFEPAAPGEGFPLSVATVFRAGNTIINAGGMFVYNGAPGPANPPVLSIVAPGVTADPYGHAVAPVLQIGAQFGGSPFTVFDQFGNYKLFSASGSAIIQISPAYEAIFLYEELFGPQGPLLAALAGKAGTDPNAGTPFPAGLFVSAGIIEGTQIIASGASGEILVYSGTPAAGNLIGSVSGAAGTDAQGNAYLRGTTSYTNGGLFFSAVSLDSGVVNWYKAATGAGPWTAEAGIGFSFNNITGGGLTLTAPAGLSGALNTPQALSGSIATLPTDNNTGTGWVSGERAFMNNNWVAVCNANFAAIVAALQAAGIAT